MLFWLCVFWQPEFMRSLPAPFMAPLVFVALISGGQLAGETVSADLTAPPTNRQRIPSAFLPSSTPFSNWNVRAPERAEGSSIKIPPPRAYPQRMQFPVPEVIKTKPVAKDVQNTEAYFFDPAVPEDWPPKTIIPDPRIPDTPTLDGVASLHGKGTLELLAFATFVPHWSPKTNAVSIDTPLYRNPRTKAEIEAVQTSKWSLDLAAPPNLADIQSGIPILRLVFRAEYLPYLNFSSPVVLNQLNYEKLNLREAVIQNFPGGVSVVDLQLRTWQDVPLKIEAEIPCGDLLITEFDDQRFSQVTLGAHVRLQVLQPHPGNISYIGYSDEEIPGKRVSFYEVASNQPGTCVIARSNSKDIFSQLGILLSNGEQKQVCWFPEGFGDLDWLVPHVLQFDDVPFSPTLKFRALYYPHVQKVTFAISGLPDLPNPRSLADYYDLRIPYLKLGREKALRDVSLRYLTRFSAFKYLADEHDLTTPKAPAEPQKPTQQDKIEPESSRHYHADLSDLWHTPALPWEWFQLCGPGSSLSKYEGLDPNIPLPSVELVAFDPSHLGRFRLQCETRRQDLLDIPLPNPWEDEIQADGEGNVSLPDRAGLKLLAYGVSVPSPDDYLLPEGFTEFIEFLHPDNGEPVSISQLMDEGFVKTELQVARRNLWHPQLRLLFRKHNLPATQLLADQVFDARTKASVIGALAPRIVETEGLLRIDYPLGIWHDTELSVALDLACGNPIFSDLPLESGGQVQIGDIARLQLAAVLQGSVQEQRWSKAHPDRVIDEFEVDPTRPGATLVLRFSSESYAPHCALRSIASDTYHWLKDGAQEERWADPRLMPLSNAEAEAEVLKVIFYPNRQRVWFHLPSLPQMPNPRDIADLYEVKIPRAGLFSDWDTQEQLKLMVQAATETYAGPLPWPRLPPGRLKTKPSGEVSSTTARKLLERIYNW